MGLFKQKSRTPVELVQHVRRLLPYADPNTDVRETKRQMKMCKLRKDIHEMRRILYGEDRPEPIAEASQSLSEEFFREDTFPLLIEALPSLDSGARTDITQVIASLLLKRFNGRSIASEYLELNTDVLDMLIKGYEAPDIEVALNMGTILKDCIRHQVVARYILGSDHIKRFFDYVQIPNFDIAADAATAFKELLTRHKSTASEFLSKNYDWFFLDYNSLLESDNYAIRRSALELLGAILLDRSNTSVMVRYVSSLDNMRILMNLLRDSSKSIQLEAFHVFKLFPANQNKPPEIVNILVGNRNKLLRFFNEFSFDKEDEQFQADKAQVVREIASLEPIVPTSEEVPC